ncbi:1-aminocyclopropane-1-carboxylate oxidase homolog 3-like protein [Tanacetum coccineum]
MQTVHVIDMSHDRSEVVEQVRNMSSTLGFFQFFERDDEYKMRFYSREVGKSAPYSTIFDLFHSNDASWRDTLRDNPPAEFGHHRRRNLNRARNKIVPLAQGAFLKQSKSLDIGDCSKNADH